MPLEEKQGPPRRSYALRHLARISWHVAHEQCSIFVGLSFCPNDVYFELHYLR